MDTNQKYNDDSRQLHSIGILTVTVAAVLYSLYSDRKQRRLMMFAEYTRRYQDMIAELQSMVKADRKNLSGRK